MSALLLLPIFSGVIGLGGHLFWAQNGKDSYSVIRIHFIVSLSFFAFTTWSIVELDNSSINISGALLATAGIRLAATFCVCSLIGVILGFFRG